MLLLRDIRSGDSPQHSGRRAWALDPRTPRRRVSVEIGTPTATSPFTRREASAIGPGRRLLRMESAFRTTPRTVGARTSFVPPTGGDRGRHAILGVGADYEGLTEPLVDRLSLYAQGRLAFEIRFVVSAAGDRLELARVRGAVAHRLGTRICARAPLWKRCSSTTSSFRCSSSLANGLWPAPIAIGIVDRWGTRRRDRGGSAMGDVRTAVDQDRPFVVSGLQVRDLRAQVAAEDLGGPQSAFFRVWEKTAFGFSFIAVAIGPSDAAQCGPMIS